MVGASVFYNDVTGVDADGNKQQTGSQSSLDRLDQELKVRLLRHVEYICKHLIVKCFYCVSVDQENILLSGIAYK